MSKYKSIGNYSSGWYEAPIRAPVMMYQANPVHNQRAPMEVVPSYGTVGYDEPVASTYKGYYSLCSGYSDREGIGCGVTDPSDPCFDGGEQRPSDSCLDLMGGILAGLNTYKIPQLVIIEDPSGDAKLRVTIRTLDNVVNELNSLLYREQECVNAIITGQSQTMVANAIARIVQVNQLVPHQMDNAQPPRPIVTFDQPLFRLQYQPDLMEVVAIPLPVNVPGPSPAELRARAARIQKENEKKTKKGGGGFFGLFKRK